jgi:hypothetical protein
MLSKFFDYVTCIRAMCHSLWERCKEGMLQCSQWWGHLYTAVTMQNTLKETLSAIFHDPTLYWVSTESPPVPPPLCTANTSSSHRPLRHLHSASRPFLRLGEKRVITIEQAYAWPYAFRSLHFAHTQISLVLHFPHIRSLEHLWFNTVMQNTEFILSFNS